MGIKIKIGRRQQLVPPGEYNARIEEIKEGTFLGKRRTLEFTFIIADGQHQGVSVRAFVNAHYEAYSEHTKLRKWSGFVTKDDLDPGNELDLDVFFDKVLKVRIETKESHKTKNPFSNVTEILGVVLDEG